MKYGVNKESLKKIIELAERSEEFSMVDTETITALKSICLHNDDSIQLIVENDYNSVILWQSKEDIEYLLSDTSAEVENMTDEEKKLFISDVESHLDWEEIEANCCVSGNEFIANAIQDVLSERTAIKTAESLGWNVTRYENWYTVGQESPAGEDFSFDAAVGSFKRDVVQYAYMFDEEEHLEMWLEASSNVRGVPSVFKLCEDAKAIKKMLDDLSIAIK